MGVKLDVRMQDGPRLGLSAGGDQSLALRSDAVAIPTDNDYEHLRNKPSIEGVELVGDKTFEELGDTPLTNMEIQAIFNRVFQG